MPPHLHPGPRGGLPYALGAYLCWGLLPIYLRLVQQVPAFEFIGWRIIWTLAFCLMVALIAGQWHEIRTVAADRRIMGRLALSALLIGINWTVYYAAIQSGHIFAASLGYYINPLANVVAGTLFLGERLSRRQWLAVGLAALAVALLALGAREMLVISLSLAVTFCAYGLVRRSTPVGALSGLTIESGLLLLPSLALVGWFAAGPAGSSFGHDLRLSGLLVLAGVVSAVPLMLFAAAATRMDYSTLGMVQYLAPTLVFILGITLFGEPLGMIQLGCFVLIWLAIAVFVSDLWAQRRPRQPA